MKGKYIVTGKFSYYTCTATISIKDVESNQIERVMQCLYERFANIAGGEPEREEYSIKPDYFPMDKRKDY